MLIRECMYHMLLVMLISWYICRIQFLQKHLGNSENNLQICEKVLSKTFHFRQPENLHKTCRLHPLRWLWFTYSTTQMYWTKLKCLIITITVVVVVVIILLLLLIIIITTTVIIKWLDYRQDILEFKSKQGQGTFRFSQNVQTGSRAYPDSYLRDSMNTFPRDKVTIAWGWPLTSSLCWG
jgi:hypothetical protein